MNAISGRKLVLHMRPQLKPSPLCKGDARVDYQIENILTAAWELSYQKAIRVEKMAALKLTVRKTDPPADPGLPIPRQPP